MSDGSCDAKRTFTDQVMECALEEHHQGPHTTLDRSFRWPNGHRPPELDAETAGALLVGDTVTLVYRNWRSHRDRQELLEDVWLRTPATVVRRTSKTVWVRAPMFGDDEICVSRLAEWFLLGRTF
jgi:hypothetical protein